MGGVVIGDIGEGEVAAVGFVEGADDLGGGDGEVACSGDSALGFDGENVGVSASAYGLVARLVASDLDGSRSSRHHAVTPIAQLWGGRLVCRL